MAREGYTFGGWRSSASGRIYSAGATVTFNNVGTTTYTAVWNRNNNNNNNNNNNTTQPITSVRINHVGLTEPWDARTISIGQTFRPTATTTPSGRAGELTWTSSNTTVATVNSNTGIIAARATGSTTIRATAPSGQNATITIRVMDGTWNSDESRIFFWNLSELGIHVEQLQCAPADFNFASHMNNAQIQWGSAVGGMGFNNAPYSNAHILAYAGSINGMEDTVREYRMNPPTATWIGLARYAPRTRWGMIYLDDLTRRNVYRLNPNFQTTRRPVMLVTSHRRDTGEARSSGSARGITLHEMGHVMGYAGHSVSHNDVMFHAIGADQQWLTRAEIDHIRRVYDRFRR